jgi:hypothetical protein
MASFVPPVPVIAPFRVMQPTESTDEFRSRWPTRSSGTRHLGEGEGTPEPEPTTIKSRQARTRMPLLRPQVQTSTSPQSGPPAHVAAEEKAYRDIPPGTPESAFGAAATFRDANAVSWLRKDDGELMEQPSGQD